ncbi:hypothetical protein OH77DRAFT_1425298 [Trametes cingulata]|nr:hypothetical protein OH77DRAFT_1425298 [Trametes cingulata]
MARETGRLFLALRMLRGVGRPSHTRIGSLKCRRGGKVRSGSRRSTKCGNEHHHLRRSTATCLVFGCNGSLPSQCHHLKPIGLPTWSDRVKQTVRVGCILRSLARSIFRPALAVKGRDDLCAIPASNRLPEACEARRRSHGNRLCARAQTLTVIVSMDGQYVLSWVGESAIGVAGGRAPHQAYPGFAAYPRFID